MPKKPLFAALSFALIACLSWATPGRAMDLGDWMVPRIGNLKYNLRYEGSYSPSRPVQGQDSDLGYVSNTGRMLIPLWQNPRDELALHGRVSYMYIDSSAVLPDSGQALTS